MTKQELFELIDGYWPVISKGRVVGLENDEGEKPLPDGVVGYVDAHPEGSDRGGYVPFLETDGEQVYHYACKWRWLSGSQRR
jgi:hypothetical protein